MARPTAAYAARGAEVKRCDQYLIVQDAVTTG
jgi:hypothetical protein